MDTDLFYIKIILFGYLKAKASFDSVYSSQTKDDNRRVKAVQIPGLTIPHPQKRQLRKGY